MADHAEVDRTPLFVGVFVILVALTLASFWVANAENLFALPQTKWQVMIGISSAKAALVVLFFMHFWWEHSWKYLLTIPTLLMAVVLVVALIPDILQRRESYSDTRLNHSAAEEASITSK
ncbi:MAG: cytochrome C oxidase subunit IV family protein [Planctomycetaceae bacterium]|nr:cytochrome C oxidase subunit IV family protein [Planctomycetaceae bacterium]